jgi:hypothetical protein
MCSQTLAPYVGYGKGAVLRIRFVRKRENFFLAAWRFFLKEFRYESGNAWIPQVCCQDKVGAWESHLRFDDAPHRAFFYKTAAFGSSGGILHGSLHGISFRRIRSNRSKNRDSIHSQTTDKDNSSKAVGMEVR